MTENFAIEGVTGPNEILGSEPRAINEARARAFGRDEYVGQESFMSASEILALARTTGITPETILLDLCCGAGGPALFLAAKTGCKVLGIDYSEQSINLAHARAASYGLENVTTFIVGDVNRLMPAGNFNAALLLETMVAIEDKGALLQNVHRILLPHGRFGLTLEDGPSLSNDERRIMPDGDSMWLTTQDEFMELLRSTGFQVLRLEDYTASHNIIVSKLIKAFRRSRQAISTEIGAAWYDDMLAAHIQWAKWFSAGRVRIIAIVAERMA